MSLLQRLPGHLRAHLLSEYVSIRDTVHVALTCKNLKNHILSRESVESRELWKVYFHREFSSVNLPPDDQTYLEAIIEVKRLPLDVFRWVGQRGYDRVMLALVEQSIGLGHPRSFDNCQIRCLLSGVAKRDCPVMYDLLMKTIPNRVDPLQPYIYSVDILVGCGATNIITSLLQRFEFNLHHLVGWFGFALEKSYDTICDLLLPYIETTRLSKCIHAMKIAIQRNNRKYIDIILARGYDYYDDCLCIAARVGNLELVKRFIALGATDYEQAFSDASKDGFDHLDVIEYLIQCHRNTN